MDTCDVLIVGGGPAGSSCAWALRDAGLDVAILDRAVFPRDKICGGWITPPALSRLEIDPSEYGRGRVLQPIHNFRVGSIGGSAVETNYGKPVSYGIRRCEFDGYLLSRSRARLLLGTPLTRLERTGGEWIANRTLRARMVVGAGGHFCPVVRLTGARQGSEAAVVAQETEFEMGSAQLAHCGIEEDTPELYFCSDMKGYGWCFRKGRFLNIGLGRADPQRLTAHVGGFLEFLKRAGRIGFAVPALRGHAYLLKETSTRAVCGDGVLLVGDAAGLAHPQSGEGILPAIESGLLAAECIIEANGSYEKRRLGGYQQMLTSNQGQWAANLGRYVPSGMVGLLGRSLLRTPWFVREVVLNRWFLGGHASPAFGDS